MNKKLLPFALVGLTALPVLVSQQGTANADVVVRASGSIRVNTPRVRVRPRVRIRPRVRVRPRHRVRYRLRVGGGFHYGWRYAAPPPPPVYAYNNECAPSYCNQPRQVVVATRPRRPLPRFGVGVFAGGMNVEDREASSDVGVLARFRLTHRLFLEGEIAKSELEDGSRVDRRMGAALLYDFSPRSGLSPHVLIGAGVVRADLNAGSPIRADQSYGEIGVGLGWRLSRSLELTADIRAGTRDTQDNEVILRSSTVQPIAKSEDYTRARLSAILHF